MTFTIKSNNFLTETHIFTTNCNHETNRKFKVKIKGTGRTRTEKTRVVDTNALYKIFRVLFWLFENGLKIDFVNDSQGQIKAKFIY